MANIFFVTGMENMCILIEQIRLIQIIGKNHSYVLLAIFSEMLTDTMAFPM